MVLESWKLIDAHLSLNVFGTSEVKEIPGLRCHLVSQVLDFPLPCRPLACGLILS